MNQDSRQQRLKSLLATQPRLHRLDKTNVNVLYGEPGSRQVPATITTEDKDALLHRWIPANMDLIKEQLRSRGGLLFRGFNVSSVELFQLIVQEFSKNAMPYTQRSSPRTEIKDRIYTSTDHPADQYINMHNELSYSPRWPLQIMFYCLQPSETGGETPIADSRQVLKALSPATRTSFKEKGIMYVRNLGGGLGLDWQTVFQTTDRSEVEEECSRNEMHFEWKDNNRLQIRWTRPAIVDHPVTGEEIWFNHAYFFNAANLDEEVADAVTSSEEMPFNTFYGDGTPISADVLKEIGDAYEKAKVIFPWKKGDVLLLDNMLMSHGRNPFEGERKIMVAMWEPNR